MGVHGEEELGRGFDYLVHGHAEGAGGGGGIRPRADSWEVAVGVGGGIVSGGGRRP